MRPRRSRRFAGAEDEPPAPRARPGHNPGPVGDYKSPMTPLGNPGHSGPIGLGFLLKPAQLFEAAGHIRKADELLEQVARAVPAALSGQRASNWAGEIDRLRTDVRAMEQEILTDAELLEAEQES